MSSDHSKTNIAYCSKLKSISGMQQFVGKEMGLSDWFKITQEDINIFAQLTHDQQWIHTDIERSKRESPFKQTIAHGFYILSLASHFAYKCLTVTDLAMGVNYGLNKVRFISPVRSGANIRGRIVLLDFKEIPNGAQYILHMTFEIKGQEKPACIAEFVAQGYTV